MSANRGTLVVYIAQTVYDCIIVSTLQFNCSIDVTVDDLDRFDLRLTICPVVILFSYIVTKTRICYFIPVST